MHQCECERRPIRMREVLKTTSYYRLIAIGVKSERSPAIEFYGMYSFS